MVWVKCSKIFRVNGCKYCSAAPRTNSFSIRSRQVAERAIRFHAMAAGNEILRSDLSPAKDVQRIMDYAGVTTAALEAAEQSGAMEAFDAALKAAFVIAGKDRT